MESPNVQNHDVGIPVELSTKSTVSPVPEDVQAASGQVTPTITLIHVLSEHAELVVIVKQTI